MKAKVFYKTGYICLSGILLSFFSCAADGNITPVGLTCENMSDPAVVEASAPRLSWINETTADDVRGQRQQAYRICVASSEALLLKGRADVWDSGKVLSSDSYLVPYAGGPLQSGKDYRWRVMVWDADGAPSGWSAPARWGMGLLTADEWKAEWIGAPWQGENPRRVIRPAGEVQPAITPQKPAPMFRRAFDVRKSVASAKAFVTGLGYFEFYINGGKVGDDCLVPNFTNYTPREGVEYTGISLKNNFRGHRVMYLAYDITDLLTRGERNVAGAIVGDGFYDSPSGWVVPFGSARFLCQIEITYNDGTKELVCSDETWRVRESPIVLNGPFEGEVYDANLEIDGWATTSVDDSDWPNAVLRTPPAGEMTAHTAPTDKVTGRLEPVTLTRNGEGAWEVDFGVEISGWIRFDGVQGDRGDTLDVKYICESPLGVQQYIFRGDEKESYAPRFTWYVFSKAVIDGVDNLTPEMLTAEAVNTDVSVSAEFRTSNPMFERINTIWQRSQLDNMHGGIASDCPHRERAPYTGDGQVAMVTVMHNFNAAAFYEKWIRDMRDAQDADSGYVPNGAPWQSGCGGGVPWGAAIDIMPWEYYLHYGDRKMLEESYFAMTEYVRYMLTWLTPDGTMFSQRTNLDSDRPNYWFNLGDWSPAFDIPSEELVHTFYLWRCADFTARAAAVLNRPDDQARFTAIANDVKAAFHRKFYDPAGKTYGDYGGNIFALVMGVPRERYDDVVNTLRHEITVKYDGHLNTGIFGTQFFFETLAANGMNDVAYEAMNKRDYPSFGHWLEQGATVTWEQWNGENSRNHPMFGGGLNWFYRTLAGVNTDENEPGYKHIIIKPDLPAKLNHVYYSNMTPYGRVVSEVTRSGGRVEMNVTVPVGSRATVHVPVSANSVVTESGRPVDSVAGVENAGVENGVMKLLVGQGKYNFVTNVN